MSSALAPRTDSSLVHAMTVDVEDYFQVSAFEGHIDRADWERLPSRVERNTERILQLFNDHGVRATFFTLGRVAERHPELIRRIVAEGHEVASHGWSHVRATDQAPAEFRADVSRTKALLEDVTGIAVYGYRAPSYSINEANWWAMEVLAAAGYRYSSSVYPIRHDHYGMPQAPRFAFQPISGSPLIEVPITTVRVAGMHLPCGGGGYFRLLPYVVSRWALRRVARREGQPAVFYFHPWELDPDQPRPPRLPARTRFRHYLNLHRVEDRLRRLLVDFSWGRMDQVFLPTGGSR